jgi:anti-sigma factor RsiW
MSCPVSRDQLWEWVYGEGDEHESAAVAAHVESCDSCRASAAEMRALIEDMSSLGSVLTPAVRALENPERIGRYRIHR